MQPQDATEEPEAIQAAKADAFSHTVDVAQKWADAHANAPSGHTWVKQGPHLVCTSCPFPHAHYDGMQHFNKPVSQPGLSAVPTPSDEPDGDITPTASTEPVKRGRKKGAS